MRPDETSSQSSPEISSPGIYSVVARRFHWCTVALIAVQLPLGLFMTKYAEATNFASPAGQLYDLHKLIGLSILALIIAPIATELPEKFNSVIWINKGKDTLAIGNVTGAMVFQGSMITAIGIMMTDWQLNTAALLTVALTFASVGMAYLQIRIKKHLTPGTLLVGGAFYFIFLLLIFTGKI